MGKPIPEATFLTAPYWEYVQQKKLCVQKCSSCEEYIFYPKAWCPTCMNMELHWVELSGRGEVLSFTIVHQASMESYSGDVPYVLVIIKLEEGPQLMANIIKCDPHQIKIGMKVIVVYEDREGFLVPQFTLNE